jgi:hypothetical protein
VKFGEYVTRGVVKVPEKFGFNRSIFGWFGHFTEHVVCSELGFWRNAYLRWWNSPEGARNLQRYARDTKEHIPPLGFTGISRIWDRESKVGRGVLTRLWIRERRERKGKAAHREEEAEVPMLEKVTGARRRRSPPVSRRGIAREDREPESAEGKESLWLGLGLEAFF